MTQILGKIVADFETSLAVKMAIGATTGTLQSATDSDGVALPTGRYFFTLDRNNASKEYISCTLTGTALTNIKTVTRQGVETSGTIREHRVGANVIISDFAHIKKLNDLLDGTSQFDAGTPLGYDGTPTISGDNQFATKKSSGDYADTKVSLTGNETVAGIKTFSSSPIVPTPTTDFQAATKKYADDLAIAGSPNASTTVKGIVEEATFAEVLAGTDTGGTGARNFVVPSLITIPQEFVATAGENITAGNSVFVANGEESKVMNAFSTTTGVGSTTTTTTWLYQSFTTGSTTTKIKRVTLNTTSNGAGGAFTVRIRSSPNGSNLASVGTGNPGTGTSGYDFDLAVSPSTVYYIVISWDNDLNPVTWNGGTTSSYSGGASGRSTNSGSSWTTPDPTVTGDFVFSVFETFTTQGQIYRTSADSSTYLGGNYTAGFIGFAKATATTGNSVTTQIQGSYRALSSLTVAVPYYLSNTLGGVSSTAGTVSKKIGFSLSSTEILIKHDN